MVAVAVSLSHSIYNDFDTNTDQAAVFAQIAMTGLSLELSNQIHCLTKASLVVSLIFAILAVSYGSCLQRKFNHLLTWKEIIRWIRRGSRKQDAKRWG